MLDDDEQMADKRRGVVGVPLPTWHVISSQVAEQQAQGQAQEGPVLLVEGPVVCQALRTGSQCI